MSFSYDVTVIGGGIVGLATAMKLTGRFPDSRVLLVEKEAAVGKHQTSHNSGVIHSGIYYAPGSLKAKLCVEGAGALVSFALEHDLRYEICGKLIIATEERELPWLRTLFERGKANGVPGLELLDEKGIGRLEPEARGLGAIYSPHTGIIDFSAVARCMQKKFEAAGGTLRTHTKLLKGREMTSGFVLETTQGEFTTAYAMNCGGLYSDVIARSMGVRTGCRIVPFRGEYFLIDPAKKDIVKHLIYPVPHPDLPFLGVHLTKTIDGKLEAGPNALLALAREGYRRSDLKWGELAGMITSGAFWKMAFRYPKTGIFEIYRSLSKQVFASELQKFVPSLQAEDLQKGPAGVRAQLVNESGMLVNDFKMIESRSAIHVLNVPSPAATASLAISEYLADRAENLFALKN